MTLPYLSHFGFTRPPFTLTPARDLFFPTLHQPLLEALIFAIEKGEGILKITGPVGTGKTLLCRLLLDHYESSCGTAYLSLPTGDLKSLTERILGDLGLSLPEGKDPYATLQAALLKRFQAGQKTLLIIDEAQTLGPSGLEAIRLLTNLETDHAKLLQIVLFGQNELNVLLMQPQLRQLRQRISFSFQTPPFPISQAMAYMAYRVRACHQNAGDALFSLAALYLIARKSKGNPRLINILADKALLHAYAMGKNNVTYWSARAAYRDDLPLLRTAG